MPRTHVVPTHLRMPETVLTVGGLSLSARQFLLLLLGAAIGYDLWLNLAVLAPLPGGVVMQVVRLLVASIPLLCALSLAFVRAYGRDLPGWMVVWSRYQSRPRRLVWRSVRFLESSLVLDGVGTEDAKESQDTQKDEYDG